MKLPLPHLIGAALSLFIATSVTHAAADEPEPTRRYADDRHPPPAARLNLALAGTAVTGLFYAPVLVSSYIWPDSRGASDMRIPVVGPWMKLGQTRLCSARPEFEDCNDFAVVAGAVLLALDGIGQAAGVGLIAQSLFFQTEPEANAGSGRSPFLWNTAGVEMSPVPMVGDGSDIGLALTGRF